MEEHLNNQRLLKDHIRHRILEGADNGRFDSGGQNDTRAAAVLFLLGTHPSGPDRPPEPCLIFNQRSSRVRQPGDLCFPGGGLSPRLDSFLASLLRLPGFPLFRWSPDSHRHSHRRIMSRAMSRLLATSLRESFEEMRLNPLRIQFLGPMAPEHFKRHNRTIYPMVAWNCGQKFFSPNWEVDRIVYIPLRHFLHPGAYARLPAARISRFGEETPPSAEFPCLFYKNSEGREVLWGLTYRIVMGFLDMVFDFQPPEASSLPVISE